MKNDNLKLGGNPAMIIQMIFFKPPTGILNPYSLAFSIFTFPLVFLILSMYLGKYKDFIKKYLSIEIGKGSFLEKFIVYICYIIFAQIFVTSVLNPTGNISIIRGKLTPMTLNDVPRAFFNIASLILIPKMASNFVEKYILFNSSDSLKIASQIFYYTCLLGMIGLNDIWNYVNVVVSLIVTFILYLCIEKDLTFHFPFLNFNEFYMYKIKYKLIFYNLFGYHFPDKNSEDYVKIFFIFFMFCFVIISSYSKYIPFYYEILGYQLTVFEVILKILFSVVLPIKFREMGKGKLYETEIFLLGNLLSIFIPILFQNIIYEIQYALF